jgi:carbon storage regulator
MLVLTRRVDEAIMIGDDIKVTLISIRGAVVRIGIDAPKEIVVHREEVYKAIKREREFQLQQQPPMGPNKE